MHSSPRTSQFKSLALTAVALVAGACAKTDSHADKAPAVYSHSQQAIWNNGDFEADALGTTPPTGWSVTTYLNSGVTGTATNPPTSFAALNLSGTSNVETSVIGGALGTQADPDLGTGQTFRYPIFGQRSAIVNYQSPGNLNGHNQNANALQQTMTIGAGDVDPTDGQIHVRFAIAPVLEVPTHTYNQQPFYFVQLTDVTKGSTLYEVFNVAGQTGIPWNTTTSLQTNVTTDWLDWQLVDISPGTSAISFGDQVQLTIIASGCSLGGHFGRVYVDGLGTVVPGPYAWATGPITSSAGSNLTYTVRYSNGGSTVATGAHVDMVTPPNTTFVSLTPPSGVTCTTPAVGASGTLSCSIGTLSPGDLGSFTVTVNVNSGATGTIVNGNYSMNATGIPKLLGSPVTTNLGASIKVVSGTPQSAGAGAKFGAPLVVQVTDSNNNPIYGATVTFTAPSSGATATLSSTTATTDPTGKASITATAGGVLGSYTVSASIAGGASPANFALTNTVGAPATLAIVSGTPQSATVGTALSPLVVQVTDIGGNPVSGATVTFSAPTSGATATLAKKTATTDASGQVSVGATAGTVPGSYTVTASSTGTTTPVSFSLTNAVGAPASITAVSGTPQSTTVATGFAAPLVAKVTDTYGNPISGATVTFAAPASGATATLSSTSGATDGTGQMTVSVSADDAAGTFTVTASTPGVTTPANFTLTAIPLPVTASFKASQLSAAVGGLVPLHATIAVPVGTIPAASLDVTLPTGLVFQQGTNLVAGPMVTCGGAPCVLSAPVVTNGGHAVHFVFADVTNADVAALSPENLDWDVVAVVENVPASVAGASLTASGAFVVNTATATSAALPVTVIEPKLSFSTTRTPITGDAGDVVNVTVHVKNPNSANGSGAYDTVVAYTLPANKMTAVPNSYAAGNCPAASSATLSGTTAQFGFAALPMGTDCTFSFQVQLGVGVTPADVPSTSTVATWTSQPGDVVTTPLSSYSAVSTERTGNVNDPGATLNNYKVTGFDFSVTVNAPSLAFTLPGTTSAPVGALVTYHASATLIEGTMPSLVVGVTLPSGLVFQQAANLAVSPSVTCGGAACALPAPSVTSGGHSILWTLSNVVDSDTNNAAAEKIEWDVVAVVANVSAAQTGATLTASAKLTAGTTNSPAAAPALTVVEPKLTFSASSTPAMGTASDLVTVTVRMQNPTVLNGATAYDAVVSYALPSGKLTAMPGSYVGGTNCPAATPTLTDTMAQVAFDSVPMGTDCSFSFQLQLAIGVNPSDVLSAVSLGTWTSEPGDVTTSQSTFSTVATERTGDTTNPGGSLNNYSQTGFDVGVTVNGSSFDFTAPLLATAAVGGQVPFHAVVTLPQGTTPLASVDVVLPPGLVFQQGANLVASAGVTCNGAPCVLPTPVSADGHTIHWALSSIVDADTNDLTTETIAWDVIAVVENAPTSVAGGTYSAVANFVQGTSTATVTTLPVTVLEPALTFAASVPSTPVDAGDVVTVTTHVQNPTVTFGAAGFDAVVSYTLPSKLTAVTNSYSAGTCPDAANVALSGTTAQFTFGMVAMGTDCTFTFQVKATDAVQMADVLSTTGTGTWTSQPGAETASVSSYSTVATERTGSASDPGGSLNTYTQVFNFNVTASSVYSLVQTLDSTSSADTAGSLVAAGEDAVLRLATTLQEGTHPDVVIADTLPAGLVATAVALDTTSFNGTVASQPSLPTTPGSDLSFDLGQVVVAGDNVATNNTVAVLVTVHPVYGAELLGGPTVTVSGVATVDGNTTPKADLALTYAVPVPQVTLTATDTKPAANATVSFTATLTNAGNGPACNTAVDIAVPAGLTLQNPGSDGIDNDGNGTTDEAGEAAYETGASTLKLPVAGCLAGGAAKHLTFVTKAISNLPPTQLQATATLEGYSTLSVAGTALTPTTDLVDNNGNTTVDEANDGVASVTLKPVAPLLTFSKLVTDLTTQGSIEPGDTLEYTITLTNSGTGPTVGAVISDALPVDHAQLKADSIQTTAGTPMLNGNMLTVSIGTLAAGTTAAVKVDLVLNKPLAKGIPVSNQAALTTQDGYGPLISDDPNTSMPNDATVVVLNSTNDVDGDGVPNDKDSDPNNPHVCSDLDHDSCDDCAVAGLQQPNNDGTDADMDGLCDKGDPRPNDNDADDDGVIDGQETQWWVDTDHDGLINVFDTDSDNDGIADGTEMGVTSPASGTDVSKGFYKPDADPSTKTSMVDVDTDHGGVPDGAEDSNHNGKVDQGETDPNNAADDVSKPVDSDNDGLTDAEEIAAGSNPHDADTDDDGVLDGKEANWNQDSDGDGIINVLDPDSDNDGLLDGTETGVMTAGQDTNVAKGVFVADADPSTTTCMIDPDTDHGGVRDGAEDSNHNGKVDSGELDPNSAADDENKPADSDNDGLTDAEEIAAGSNPHDADTDDDGVLDGKESNWNVDSDGDGLINVLDTDSDNDGLTDGTEAGVTTPDKDTDTSKHQFVPDTDPTTTTSMIAWDMDHGGVSDGAEDTNHNGKVDQGETDPNNAADDMQGVDSDHDGLSDAEELAAGTNPHDADSDDDGIPDGQEPNWNQDTDGDGLINALDPDSDNDCVFDGTELGYTQPNADTNVSRGFFIADADPETHTNPMLADTDHGGVADGLEDANRNGKVDADERDPRNPADDQDRASDHLGSGNMCNPGTLTPGIAGGVGAEGGGCNSVPVDSAAWTGLLAIGFWLRRRRTAR